MIKEIKKESAKARYDRGEYILLCPRGSSLKIATEVCINAYSKPKPFKALVDEYKKFNENKITFYTRNQDVRIK